MASKTPSDLNLALAAMRSALNWKQSELAEAARVRGTTISDFERGNRAFSLEKLTELAGVLGLPPEAVPQARTFVRSMELQAKPPGYSDQDPGGPGMDPRKIEQIATQAGTLASDFTRSMLEFITFHTRSAAARQHAQVLWQRMRKRLPSQRRDLVESDREFRSWALCELICKESIKAAADNADRARDLAELALRIAELAPGAASWRWRLQGYAWAHVGNARRVGGDLPEAEKAFGRAGELWEMGEAGDPGILDDALLPGLEASLRIAQCRLSEAAALLNRALAVDKGTLRKHLLLSRARLLEWDGDYAGALATLQQASSLVSPEDDPRLHWMLQLNSALNLCHLNRYEEAKEILPEIQVLTVQLDNELDALRLLWLEGRISAGLGRPEHSIMALSRLRTEFVVRGIAYDAALATLELAVLYLEKERVREVKMLSREMAPIFRAQGVHREALAALKLFCEAAENELATVGLVRRMVEYLYRARHNPSLRFEEFP
jgi:transcriptional regulator with XRE-family HTH domain